VGFILSDDGIRKSPFVLEPKGFIGPWKHWISVFGGTEKGY
jgi:hypothetical protein